MNSVCCDSSATFGIRGVTSDGLSDWNAIFRATFTAPNDQPAAQGSFQQTLDDLATNGQFSASYTGPFTVASAVTPEPSALSLFGIALLLLAYLRFHRRCAA